MTLCEWLLVGGMILGCIALFWLGLRHAPTMTREEYYNRKQTNQETQDG